MYIRQVTPERSAALAIGSLSLCVLEVARVRSDGRCALESLSCENQLNGQLWLNERRELIQADVDAVTINPAYLFALKLLR
ncbi:hypothetical protein VI03_14305 [Burkholderia vietnamiensis]|nr:hypothetical protein VI03_14305 [Burkholderia vietnamiensis]